MVFILIYSSLIFILQVPFHYSNMLVLPPAIHYGITSAGNTAHIISQWQNKIKAVFKQNPINFIPLESFNSNNVVSNEQVQHLSGVENLGPNPAQDFGKLIRPNSMTNTSEKKKLNKRKTIDTWVKTSTAIVNGN